MSEEEGAYPLKRISMWSGPRNVSTAFMYAFHHRGDCAVIDEPFYAHYLQQSRAQHPMRKEVLEAQEQDANKLIQHLTSCTTSEPYLFMKNMPHHMVDVDMEFVKNFQNFFLIREPRAMIASYLQKMPEVQMSDLGLDMQHELFCKLTGQGQDVTVIDSQTLLAAPEKTLEALCKRLEIPFKESMISWPAGAIPQDGIWARHWYANVHSSAGFGKVNRAESKEIPAQLESLAKECEEYYQELKKFEIRP